MVGLSTRAGRSWRGALIGGFVLAGAMTPAADAAGPARATEFSLCRTAEAPLFVCPIGRKSAVICAARSGTAVYRYGRPGRVELEAGRLVTAYRGFSGGGERQVSFVRGGSRYILFDGTYRTAFGGDGRNEPQDRSGLVVQQNGRTVMQRACGGDARMGAGVERRIPRGAFVAH